MTHKFADIAFTPTVKAEQERMGSRAAYAHAEGGPAHHDRLGEHEAASIATRDSVYTASVGETGWPYIQHRGGPAGFIKVLDAGTLGFADFRGNRQYVSVGNLAGNDRVALFFMDYPHRARLKLLGRARLVECEGNAELMERLALPGYRARVERAIIIAVEAFDWNCSQHITPAFYRRGHRRRGGAAARQDPRARRAAPRAVKWPGSAPMDADRHPLTTNVCSVGRMVALLRQLSRHWSPLWGAIRGCYQPPPGRKAAVGLPSGKRPAAEDLRHHHHGVTLIGALAESASEPPSRYRQASSSNQPPQ